MSSLVEFENITYRYDGNEQLALTGLSLEIPAGKKCVLLGSNGAGKSTVLLLMNGLLKPSSGNYFWKGKTVHFNRKELKQLHQKIGLLFQNADEMLITPTVFDDLSYGLINAGYSGERLKGKVDQLVAEFNLEELKNRPIHYLSLGEKRRVALAGVIGLEPELLLLDEPTTYLDPVQTTTFIKELNKIHNQGTTVVMSTHDLDLAYEWADWVFVVTNGQLAFAGAPDDLFGNGAFVLQHGLTVPLLFQLKQLVKQNHLDLCIGNENDVSLQSQEEILSYLKIALGKIQK